MGTKHIIYIPAHWLLIIIAFISEFSPCESTTLSYAERLSRFSISQISTKFCLHDHEMIWRAKSFCQHQYFFCQIPLSNPSTITYTCNDQSSTWDQWKREEMRERMSKAQMQEHKCI